MMHITVIGSGVIGLTSAIRLLEAGHIVTIIAAAFPPDTTSDKAGAIWAPSPMEPLVKVRKWGRISYRVLCELAAVQASGVALRQLRQIESRAAAIPDWAMWTNSAESNSFSDYPPPFQHGFDVTIPLIDVPVYMPYLFNRFLELDGEIEQRTVKSFTALADAADLIINCTGIGARQLAADPGVYPKRGQTVLVEPLAPQPLAFLIDTDGQFAYLFPRSNDMLVGGTAQIDNWELSIDDERAQAMLAQACRFEPRLAAATVVGNQVGLRPMRSAVRLEVDKASATVPIIHNYGHCGIGHSLAWGCADEVATLAAIC